MIREFIAGFGCMIIFYVLGFDPQEFRANQYLILQIRGFAHRTVNTGRVPDELISYLDLGCLKLRVNIPVGQSHGRKN